MTYWIWENLGIISLFESMTEEGVVIVDVRDLNDVEKNVEKVVQKINIVTSLLLLGERVAIRCVAGINRSCGIALGVMCYMGAYKKFVKERDLSAEWNYTYKVLKAKVGRAMITPQLERTIKAALHKLDGRYK